MPPYDQWILLAVVSAVAALLVIVARQARPPLAKTSETISAPETATAEPSPRLVPAPSVAPALASAPSRPPKRKRKKVKRPTESVPKAAPAPTPIQAVLGMLKQKDALATAFVLREILDAPLSRRPR